MGNMSCTPKVRHYTYGGINNQGRPHLFFLNYSVAVEHEEAFEPQPQIPLVELPEQVVSCEPFLMAAFMANPANASPTKTIASPSTIKNCVIVYIFRFCDL